jgi:hypothetical protein
MSGCSSDSEDCTAGPVEHPNQQAPIDGTSYRQSSMDCRLPKVQTFQFNGFEETEIAAAQGAVFFVQPLSFTDLNGQIIDGEINFEVLEMYTPGDIIACQLSTNGLNNNQSVEPLLSEGIFHIDISHQGEPVLITQPIRVFIPSENASLDLSLFHSPSCPELSCSVLWEKDPQGEVIYEPYTDPGGDTILGYQTFIQNTGWKSIARFNDSQEPRGIIYNIVPPGFNDSNSNVFLYYNSPSTAIGMFSEYDAENEVFSEKFGEIPNNTQAHVIFVSKPENEFSFGSKPVTTQNGKITATRDVQLGTENTLKTYINNL